MRKWVRMEEHTEYVRGLSDCHLRLPIIFQEAEVKKSSVSFLLCWYCSNRSRLVFIDFPSFCHHCSLGFEFSWCSGPEPASPGNHPHPASPRHQAARPVQAWITSRESRLMASVHERSFSQSLNSAVWSSRRIRRKGRERRSGLWG